MKRLKSVAWHEHIYIYTEIAIITKRLMLEARNDNCKAIAKRQKARFSKTRIRNRHFNSAEQLSSIPDIVTKE